MYVYNVTGAQVLRFLYFHSRVTGMGRIYLEVILRACQTELVSSGTLELCNDAITEGVMKYFSP